MNENSSKSLLVRTRLMEICPARKLDEMTSDEVNKAVHTAFTIIGYYPTNLNDGIQYADAKSKAEWLHEYIYDVWRHTDE